MRLLIATLISLSVCGLFFLIIKGWGSSQLYIEYKHPFYSDVEAHNPLIFQMVTPQMMTKGLDAYKNIYLHIAVTSDKKLIVIDRAWEEQKNKREKSTRKFQSRTFEDIKSGAPRDPVLLETFKDKLSDKRIIFNMQDNPLQATTVFLETMKTLGLESGNNFIFLSEYDPPSKDLKSEAPTFLYGASEPEVLRIKALESIYLIEAATFRADIVIYPLNYYNQPFFTPTLVKELNHRFKRFIIGPVLDTEFETAKNLKPLGIIVR